LEDRGFLARRRIAGDGAADSEAQFTAIAPFLSARDYLLTVFRELAKLPGAADLFDARHNPVWVLAPSADGAGRLLDFFRKPDKKGNPPPEFDGTDTRFLGDLYQNLSEEVRKRYALLQTPEFVEEFILEQTLDPAIAEFGLAEVRLIDPTCGSGHFLLGAFRRLYEAWLDQAPGEDRQVLAQWAMGQVHGVDINPYAVAIARFRLTLEFLQTVGITRLERAPRLPLNLCVADSLLHGVTGQQAGFASVVPVAERKAWGDDLFALEDEDEALRVLGQRYHAVVGNPPYVRGKDSAKNRVYKELYEACVGRFILAVPFLERFFRISTIGGFVGLINANYFAKREYGKKLIGEVLPRLDIYKIIDTAGAHIPGHRTPTLILLGRNRCAAQDQVTAVLGKRGERQEPVNPRTAPVWNEIAACHNEIGFDGRYVSVETITREELKQHPWVLAGGGARRLKKLLDSRFRALRAITKNVGVDVITRASELLEMTAEQYTRHRVSNTVLLSYQFGNGVRDWSSTAPAVIPVPYDRENWELQPIDQYTGLKEFLWPHRDWLSKRFVSGGTRMNDVGLPYYALPQIPGHKHRQPMR
ncbi:MAG: BREX-2 system adenine-specific DNA-methyltransferase PglX, partial [bacterium]|nr:BREX-2 system adenine-specific DNA-methyltransferase PglX [bacterium]